MKKLLTFLFFGLSSLLGQSIYPLSFTFDDSNLYISSMDYRQDKINAIELSSIGGNAILVGFEYPIGKDCPKIKTIDQFFDYQVPKDKLNECGIYQKTLKATYLKGQDIIIDKWRILLFGNANVTIAMIFNENNFAGLIFDMPFNDKQFFSNIVKSIKTNKNIKKIDEYLKEGNENIEIGLENIAMKNLISAILLDQKHKGVKALYQRIYNYKKLALEVTWGYSEFLDNSTIEN
jgi:hypothetical protein